jgi:hypothetical protein
MEDWEQRESQNDMRGDYLSVRCGHAAGGANNRVFQLPGADGKFFTCQLTGRSLNPMRKALAGSQTKRGQRD